MFWWFTAFNHKRAISGLWQTLLTIPFVLRAFVYSVFFLGSAGISSYSLIELHNPLPLMLSACVWFLGFLDLWLEGQPLASLKRRYHVTYATRVKYLGGHPAIPHSRYMVISITGTLDYPLLALHYAKNDYVAIPLIELESTEEKRERDNQELANAALAVLSERPGGALRRDKVTLHVNFKDEVFRKQTVEFANFQGGNSEIRNWRNYLITTLAEAEYDPRPVRPWRRLPATRKSGSSREEYNVGVFGKSFGRIFDEYFAVRRR